MLQDFQKDILRQRHEEESKAFQFGSNDLGHSFMASVLFVFKRQRKTGFNF